MVVSAVHVYLYRAEVSSASVLVQNRSGRKSVDPLLHAATCTVNSTSGCMHEVVDVTARVKSCLHVGLTFVGEDVCMWRVNAAIFHVGWVCLWQLFVYRMKSEMYACVLSVIWTLQLRLVLFTTDWNVLTRHIWVSYSLKSVCMFLCVFFLRLFLQLTTAVKFPTVSCFRPQNKLVVTTTTTVAKQCCVKTWVSRSFDLHQMILVQKVCSERDLYQHWVIWIHFCLQAVMDVVQRAEVGYCTFDKNNELRAPKTWCPLFTSKDEKFCYLLLIHGNRLLIIFGFPVSSLCVQLSVLLTVPVAVYTRGII